MKKGLDSCPETFCEHIILQCFDQFVCQAGWDVGEQEKSNLACEVLNRNVLQEPVYDTLH